jgi:hypothetical protein
MKRMKLALSAAMLVSAFASSPAYCASWVELSAGDTLATAEAPVLAPGDTLDHLYGLLDVTIPVDSPFSVVQTDLYKIYVSDTADFSATTTNAGTVDDTVLYLFDADGYGIFSNDDDANGVQSTLPVGTLAGLSAGYYYIATGITGTFAYGSGGSIFDASGNPASPSGGALAGWTASTLSTSQASLFYEIDFTGVGVAAAVPEPATGLLMLAGLAGLVARRARRAATARA